MTAEFPAPAPLGTAAPPRAATPDGKAAISVNGLWKVFGPAEHKVIGTPLEDEPKQQETDE